MKRIKGVKPRMPRRSDCDCRDFSEGFVRIVSAFFMALSLVFIGFGAFLVANLGETLGELGLASPAVGTLVFGLFLLAFSATGIVGTYTENKAILACYVVGTVFLTLAILAAGAALLAYTSFLENVGANRMEVQLEDTIMTYELAVFEVCCDETAAPRPQSCEETDDVLPCFGSQSRFESFVDFIGSTTCGFLAEFEASDGSPLVSKSDPAGCAGQDVEAFVKLISEFFEDNLQTLGTVNLVLAFLMMVLLGASCHILWTKDTDDFRRVDNYHDHDDDDDEY